ncbi:MAG TPA: lysylphosphatidylglycerol synthase domain-containing protein [Rhodanobacteraceae bacterium]|nr:lysylphosphatidylglycerol synthase domain-containing protein [Rhodanobacteraceae bacterium]
MRRLVRYLGILASLAALAWIAFRFARSGAFDLLANAPADPLALARAVALCAGGYAIAMCFLAVAWWQLVSALSPHSPTARETMATYAVSQYGKYLPGNFAHYALRHAWSRRAGIPHAALALAAMLEAALLLVAALAAALLGDTTRLRVVSALDPRLAIALLLVMLAGFGFALRFVRRMHVFERFRMPPPPRARVLVACTAIYFVFMVASAVLLAVLARTLGIGFDSFAILLAANAASWAAGFIVIGAPGGLGVREVAFVALAGATLGESGALLLIGIFRIVTFLGDTLFFAAGSFALRGANAARRNTSIPDHRSPP